MPKTFVDDEGNEYTEEEVRQASEAMAKDELGEGTLGGLAEGEEPQPVSTAATTPAVPVAPQPAPGPRQRELDPRKFGEFFKTNIFGGLGGGYITGKRPMTLFDYATDVLAAYGGEDLGKRNTQIIRADIERQKVESQKALTTQRIATGRAQERKVGLETEKLVSDAVADTINNLDSDLWEQELSALAKEHNIRFRPGVVAMVTRMAEGIKAAGAKSPAEILADPDRYDPALVNRVRHTLRLATKSAEESENRRLQAEQSKAALGLRTGEEQRKQEQFAQQQLGLEEVLDILSKDLQSGDPNVVNRARSRMASLLEGGTTRQKVLEEMGGIQTRAAGRGLSVQITRDAAIDELTTELGREPTPAEIKARMNIIEGRAAGERATQTGMAQAIAKGRTNTTRAISMLSDFRQAVKEWGLAKGALGAHFGQPFKRMWDEWKADPKYSNLLSFPGLMGQLARGISFETGVLTNPDLDRIRQAVEPRTGFIKADTEESYESRMAFLETAMVRAQAELEAAASEGRSPKPVDLSDITFPGDPGYPEESGMSVHPRATRAQGMTAAEAKAELEAARALPKGSPERKAALRAALARAKGQ